MRKTLRHLRLCWSFGCAITFVLLSVLWVRSYWLIERIDVVIESEDTDLSGISLISVCGRSTLDVTYVTTDGELGIEYYSYPPDPDVEYLGIGRVLFIKKPQPGWLVSVPYWLSMSFITILAVAPWLSCRFRIRTLLIATTLVAMGLGLIVYAVR
jgi:hypothetical protein